MNDLIRRRDVIATLKALECLGYIECKTVGAIKEIEAIPSADRPKGYWIKVYIATYRCSECGKIQYADDENELNYCCCCGSHNKIRKVIGTDDDH